MSKRAEMPEARAGGRLFLAPYWLLPGGALVVTAVLAPVTSGHGTIWTSVRLAVFLASFPCFLLARPAFSIAPKAGRNRMLVFVYIAFMFVVYLLASGAANGWSADHAVSDFPDPVSYFVQSKIFARGQVALPSPEPPGFFNTPYMLSHGPFVCMYPPGWPAILAFGTALRMPWAVNPLLMTLVLCLVFRLGSELYDARTAWTATILAASSPSTVFNAATYFSEAATLLFSTLAVYALLRIEQGKPIRQSILWGLCVGMVALIRPYTAVSLALPMVVFFLARHMHRPRALSAACAAAASFGPLVVLHLSYNHYCTGSALLFPLTVYNPSNALGFGWRSTDAGLPLQYFGPVHATIELLRESISSNATIIPLVFLLMAGALFGRRRREDWLLFACVASIVLFHSIYFFHESRHWIPVLFAMALLSARGLSATASLLLRRFQQALHASDPHTALLLPLIAAMIVSSAWTVHMTVRRHAVLADPYLRSEASSLTNAVVFLSSTPARFHSSGLYVQDLPEFDPPVIYVTDLGDRNQAFLRRFPSRRPYRYEFNPETGTGVLLAVAAAQPSPAPYR